MLLEAAMSETTWENSQVTADNLALDFVGFDGIFRKAQKSKLKYQMLFFFFFFFFFFFVVASASSSFSRPLSWLFPLLFFAIFTCCRGQGGHPL